MTLASIKRLEMEMRGRQPLQASTYKSMDIFRILMKLTGLVLITGALCTPSFIGEMTKDLFPSMSESILANVYKTVDDVTDNVQKDMADFFTENFVMRMVPANLRKGMNEGFIKNIARPMGNVLKPNIKKYMAPKLKNILQEVNDQLFILDKDLDRSMAAIHNKIRDQWALKPLDPSTAAVIKSAPIPAAQTTPNQSWFSRLNPFGGRAPTTSAAGARSL